MLVYIDDFEDLDDYFVLQSEQNGVAKYGSSEGPAAWAYSFEKLLEDPLGLLIFAVSIILHFLLFVLKCL